MNWVRSDSSSRIKSARAVAIASRAGGPLRAGSPPARAHPPPRPGAGAPGPPPPPPPPVVLQREVIPAVDHHGHGPEGSLCLQGKQREGAARVVDQRSDFRF